MAVPADAQTDDLLSVAGTEDEDQGRWTARDVKRSDQSRNPCSGSDSLLASRHHGSRAPQRRGGGGGSDRSRSQGVGVETANHAAKPTNNRRRHCHHRGSAQHNAQGLATYIKGTEPPNSEMTISDLRAELDRLKSENNALSRQLRTSQSGGDSGYQNTMTDDDGSSFAVLSERFRDLEAERDALREALADSLAQLRELQANAIEVSALKKHNQQLQEDVLLLKNTVYRLNVELEKYQDRLRALRKTQDVLGEIPTSDQVSPPVSLSSAGAFAGVKPTPMSSNMLGPLVEAYQETIREKDLTLQTTQREVTAYETKCKELVADNEGLRAQLALSKQEVSALQDVRKKLEDADHHSESLLQKLEADNTHLHEMQKQQVAHENEQRAHVNVLQTQLDNCRTELLTLRGRYSVLSEQHVRLQEGSDRLIPLSVHTAAVNECKRLFEELKVQYEYERERFARKVASLQAGRPELEARLESETADRSTLQANNKALEKVLRRCQQKNEELSARLVSASMARDEAKRQLHRAMCLVRDLVLEQEGLVRALQERQQESEAVAKLGTNLVHRVGNLKTKLKDVQHGAYEELDLVEKRMRERAEGAFKNEMQYKQEVKHLRSTLRQKQKMINQLQQEKSKTEEDLEFLWQTVSTDNAQLRERKLGKAADDERYASNPAPSVPNDK